MTARNIFGYKHFPLLFVLIINWMVFLPVIIYFPDFIADDFLIFANIKQNLSIPVSLNINTEYFLFFRPVSYFFLWANYHIWGNNPFGMKLFVLIVHSIYVAGLYFLYNQIKEYIKYEIDNRLIIVIILLVTLHTDSFYWIFWICNITELLVVLFYTFALLAFVSYMKQRKSSSLYLFLLLYLLSILSKQQSLQLPLLLTVVLLLYDKYFHKSEKKVFYFLTVGILIMGIVSFINFAFSSHNVSVINNLWKKPFSIIGTTIYVFTPLFGTKIYQLCLLHKELCVLCSVVFAMWIWKILYRKYHLSLKYIFRGLVLFLIIYYPRMAAIGGGRLNSIIIFWFGLFMLIMIPRFDDKKNLFGGMLIIMISLNLYAGWQSVISGKQVTSMTQRAIMQLQKEISDNENKYLIVVRNLEPIEYMYYYYKSGDFGKQGDLRLADIIVYAPQTETCFSNKYLYAQKNENTVSVFCVNENVTLVVERNFYEKFHLSDYNYADNGRGFDRITFSGPKKYMEKQLIYFDGIRWIKV